MNPHYRLVTKIPLHELWNDDGILFATNHGLLSIDAIKALLRTDDARFVIADVGKPLIWMSSEQSLSFWQRVAKLHIVQPSLVETGFDPGDFPDAYCYVASLWRTNMEEPIILLSVAH